MTQRNIQECVNLLSLPRNPEGKNLAHLGLNLIEIGVGLHPGSFSKPGKV